MGGRIYLSGKSPGLIAYKAEPLAGQTWDLVEFEGFVDNNNSAQFQTQCRACLVNTDCLCLDLSGLTYISSTGVGILISLNREASTSGKSLFVCRVPETIKKVFDLLGFSDMFRILSDPREIASIHGKNR